MLSFRLVQYIEDHWDVISKKILAAIVDDPYLEHYRKLPEQDLLNRVGDVSRNLGRWLGNLRSDEIAKCYRPLGSRRFAEGIPLREVVHAAHLMERKIIRCARDWALIETAIDLYAQEELEHRIAAFFDGAVCHLIEGYELAWHSRDEADAATREQASSGTPAMDVHRYLAMHPGF